MSKRIKHIYFVTQQNGNNLLLNIRLKYIQKIPVKYLVIKKHNFKFSSLYSKQLFQQKTLRTYYNIMSKRFLKDLYIKAKKKNIQKSF
jgi:ribosomal protein S4